ncbi:MAG: DPP IV N-terminal domain-containing protein, partial [bacterium]
MLQLDEAGFRQPYLMDVASRALRPVLKGDFEAHTVLGFSPDSKDLFVLANRDDFAAMNVYRVAINDGTMTALGQAPDDHRNAAVSKDGRFADAVAGNWAARAELKLL